MSSTCITSLDICAIRVARLAASGAPLTGASNGYVSIAPQKLGVTVTTESGESDTVKNGCGALMATFEDPELIKSVELAVDYSQLDAGLLQIQTGASVFTDSGDIIGMQLPAVGAEPPPVCFEAWSKAWENDSQLVAPFTDPDVTYIHWVFPFTRWVQGDFTMEHKLMIVPVNGKGKENSQITVDGPFNDWPTAIAAQGGVTRMGGWFYDTNLPANDDCDFVEVTSIAS